MAHGGHCGGHHYHHHYRSRGEPQIPLPIAILLIVIWIALLVWIDYEQSDIDGKTPLEGSYQTYPNYLLDETGYLSDHWLIIDGLKYLHQKTNVQVVVMVESGTWSDRKVVDKYYELFDDEAHVLIVITSSWYESHDYYAIGDLANNVIDDRAANYLIDTRINNSKNGEKWQKELKDFADELLSTSN